MARPGHERTPVEDRSRASLILSLARSQGLFFDIDTKYGPTCGPGDLEIIAVMQVRPVIEKHISARPPQAWRSRREEESPLEAAFLRLVSAGRWVAAYGER
jgi:hypothetical protein